MTDSLTDRVTFGLVVHLKYTEPSQLTTLVSTVDLHHNYAGSPSCISPRRWVYSLGLQFPWNGTKNNNLNIVSFLGNKEKITAGPFPRLTVIVS